MITLYIGDISPLSDPAVFAACYGRIDAARQKKTCRYRQEADRRRSLLAGYLLQKGIKEMHSSESGLPVETAPLSLSYTYGPNQKPYLSEYPGIYFNLSHSGNYVVCALAGEEIGVDIQSRREIKTAVAERFFSPEDNELLKQSRAAGREAEEKLFCDIWSVKEAYIKLSGRGLSQGMDTSAVIFEKKEKQAKRKGTVRGYGKENRDAFFVLYDGIKNYSLAVCCHSEITDIIIKETQLI